jgi:hypothetical protein
VALFDRNCPGAEALQHFDVMVDDQQRETDRRVPIEQTDDQLHEMAVQSRRPYAENRGF